MNIEYYVRRALELVVEARLGEVDCEEALDGLWELLMNIDYELKSNVNKDTLSIVHNSQVGHCLKATLHMAMLN